LFLGQLLFSGNKRTEDLIRLPQSATVLNRDSLTAPALEPGAEFVNLRGIGPLGYPLSADDSTIAYSFAGVPTTNFGFPPATLDIQRVEALRGPQGTMFGRNALGERV